MKLKNILMTAALALISGTLLTACCTSGSNDNENPYNGRYDSRPDSQYDGARGRRVDFNGKVYYDRSYGGHYMIRSDAGYRYHPLNLPHGYRKDGLRVEVSGMTRGRAMEGTARALDIDSINRL